MNNIDILEEKIKIIESLCTDDCINKETVIKPLKYAISTLIAENKELKENKKYIIKMTDEQYSRVIELVECDINKKWKCKIKAKIGKRMQKNNNTIHNAKLKHGKDYVYYDDVQEAKEENRICKEILQSLLEKE